MTLPKFLQPCFPSYHLKSLDKKRDKKLIITQIFNFGTEKDLEWLSKNYPKKDLKQAVSKPNKGVWLKDVLLYWKKIFNLKIAKKDFKKAILDINPRF